MAGEFGTQLTARQITDTHIRRHHLNTTIEGKAVIAKILTGTNSGVKIQSSTGVDTGTGDVALAIDILGVTASTNLLDSDYTVFEGLVEGEPVLKKILFTTLLSKLEAYFDLRYAHEDYGVLRNLNSRSVSVIFSEEYDSIPYGRSNLKVYREVSVELGKLADQQVLIYNLTVTTTGFTFEIDSSEALAGIEVEYFFKNIV